MTKKAQIAELKRMVDRTIKGFSGRDQVTKDVNAHLALTYLDLCKAYNVAHGWLPKSKSRRPRTLEG